MDITKSAQFVIVGAGQAGGWAAKTLRDSGFAGRIVLLGDERHPPYERPPLSKAVLTGAQAPERCYLWPSGKLDELEIDFQPGSSAVAIERGRRQVLLADGRAVPYQRLLLTTGARPRRLNCPGANLQRIHYLRTIHDCLGIAHSMGAAKRLLVIGGGWIGLEVAASAILQGAEVTLVETADRLCGRSLSQSLSSYFLDLHTRRGVDVRLRAKPVAFEGRGQVERVVFEDGATLDVSAVVIGIGIEPNVELAVECGLEVNNGVVVNESGCTSDPNIFAAGDVTNQPYGGYRIRLESWKNAQDQGIAVAKAMLDQEPPKRDVPWYWSDQYDVNFQMLGIPSSTCGIFQTGDPASGAFTQYFVDGDRLRAVAAINSPRDLREAKRSMAGQLPFGTAELTAVTCVD